MLAEMIEQRRQFVFEQGQPMLHPGQPPPLADGLVERVPGRVSPELLPIGGAEPPDTVLVEQRLRRGHQGKGVGGPRGALVGGVEPPHRLDLVAEEIEPKRACLARRVQIDDRPAHRELARVMDRVGPLIAIGDQQLDQPVALGLFALGQAARQLANPERGQHPLSHGIGGRDQQLRRLALHLERLESR